MMDNIQNFLSKPAVMFTTGTSTFGVSLDGMVKFIEGTYIPIAQGIAVTLGLILTSFSIYSALKKKPWQPNSK